MIYLAHGLLAIWYALAAISLYHLRSPRSARQRAYWLTATGLVFAIILTGLSQFDYFEHIGPHLELMPHKPMQFVMLVLAVMAFAIVSFAPLQTHKAKTFAHTLFIFAFIHLSYVTDNIILGTISWVAVSLIAWRELKLDTQKNIHKAFFAYQFLAVMLLIAGLLVLNQNSDSGLGIGLIAVAVLIRNGVLPFHSWLVSFVEKAPIGIILAFTVAQFGYLSVLVEPIAHQNNATLDTLAFLGATTAVVAALLSIGQIRGRRSLGYLIMSQAGILTFGFASQTELGIEGSLYYWYGLCLSLTGFSLLLTALKARRGALDMSRADGNFAHTPRLAIGFLLTGFASVSFPLSFGFAAEDILVQGTIIEHPVLSVVIVLATAINGFNILRMFLMLFAGRNKPNHEPDINYKEYLASALVIIPLYLFGFLPQNFINAVEGQQQDNHAQVYVERHTP